LGGSQVNIILNIILLINIGMLFVLMAGVYILKKKGVKFSLRVLIGLGLGAALGAVLQLLYGANSEEIANSMPWYSLVGNGYVKLLQMIAIPLVFISILSAFTKMTAGRNVGKIAGLVLALLIGTTAISAIVGIGTTVVFDLQADQIIQGEEETARGEALVERAEAMQGAALPQQILELLPANPFYDLTGARATSTIAVVIFAAFLGFAYLQLTRREPNQAATITNGIDALHALVMGIVRIVLRLTPYGILAIMARTVATSDFEAIYALGRFVAASYAALFIVFIIHLLILAATGLRPLIYVKKAAETLLFAFTSRTSAGTLPMNIQTQTKRLGVPEGIANLSGSFGLSIGQNGCAGIYPAMLAVMIAPMAGIDPLTPSFLASVVLIVAISSFGVAGVGGGATFAAILVLSALDLPLALAGILISVEPLIDMGRTALNVSGSMTAGVTTARLTGELDMQVYNAAADEKPLVES
jgi:uncharacterized protein